MIFNKVKLFVLIATILFTSSITAFAASEEYEKLQEFNFVSFLCNSEEYKTLSSQGYTEFFVVNRGLNEHPGGWYYVYEIPICKPDLVLPDKESHYWSVAKEYDGVGGVLYLKINRDNLSDYKFLETSFAFLANSEQVLISSTDVFLSDGSTFFLQHIPELPLPATIQGELKKMVVVVVSSMKSLTVLGISLLALLIGFLLLRKVFRKFRVV